MSANADSNSADLQPKPMKGKYDGRRTNGRHASGNKPGPKPLYLKHMSRNAAARTIEQFDSIATAAQIYARAWEAGKLESCIQMRSTAEYRLYGKPFTAENPEKAKTADPMAHDSRLQDAIKRLLPPRKAVM
jgi:hypothetical protein